MTDSAEGRAAAPTANPPTRWTKLGDNILWFLWTLAWALAGALVGHAVQLMIGVYTHWLWIDGACAVAVAVVVRGFGHVRSLVRKADECVDKAATFMETAGRVEAACDDLSARVGELEETARQLVDSPVGKYVAATATKPEVASAAGKVLEAASQEGDGSLKEADATRLLVEIAHRLEHLKAGKYYDEKGRFEHVSRHLAMLPSFMRSTDMRTPQRWDLDNLLHGFTTAIVDCVSSQEARWACCVNGVGYRRCIPQAIAQAVKQCLSNFDALQAKRGSPLSHARRWIGCSLWDHGAATLNFEELACGLFHGCKGEESIEDFAGLLVESFEERLTRGNACAECTFSKKRDGSCPPVDPEKVRSLDREKIHPTLRQRSIYEGSNLYLPSAYWPVSASGHPGLTKGLADMLSKKAPLQVLEVHGVSNTSRGDANSPPTGQAVCAWCRVLFWDSEYIAKEKAQLQQWDSALAIPTFWIDPKKGLSATESGDASPLNDYFVASGLDYLYMKDYEGGGECCAFQTSVEPGKFSKPLADKPAFLDNFADLLELLSKPEGDDRVGGRMLAAQALSVYKERKGQ